MNEFFKWLLVVSPIGINIVVSALVTFITVMFLQRYELQVESIWPLKITHKPVLTKKTVRIGDVPFPNEHPKAKEFFDGSWKGEREIPVRVNFTPPFRNHVDYVTVSLKKIDIGDGINRLEVHTGSKIDTTGFDLYFKTWHDSIVWNAEASWIALGE